MFSNRQWMALCLAGGCWGSLALAQDETAEPSAPSSAFPTPSSGTTTRPDSTSTSGIGRTSDAVAADESGATSAFDPTPSKPATNTTELPPGEPPPAGGVEGTEDGSRREAPPTYTLPGFYGSPGVTLTGGEGRLARPRFRYNVGFSQGYDDNIFQTPNDQERAPDQVIVIDPGTPDTTRVVAVTRTTLEPGFSAGQLDDLVPVTRTTLETVVVPGRPAVTETIRSPEPEDKQGSTISRLSLGADAQFFTRRSVFTADLNGNVDYYWNRPAPSDKQNYAGSLSLAYLYRWTPRLTFSATTNIAYISQPDLTRINTPERLGSGDLVNGLARLNISYRLTPRLSATVSVAENAIYYVESLQQFGNSFETTFGTELRYLWKPRYTLLAEVRHSMILYPDLEDRDSATETLLIGGELALTSRLQASLRIGAAFRTFDQSGKESASPYGETTLAYRLSPTSSILWSSRYGFEEPPDQNSEALTYRSSLTYAKNFTPRFSTTATIYGVYRSTTNDLGGDDVTEETFDASIALQYRITRNLTFTGTFSFTKSASSGGNLDYDRQRVFLGGTYEF